VKLGCDIAEKYSAEVVLLHVLLRDHLTDSLQELAQVEYHSSDKPFSEAIAAIPEGRFPIVDFIPKNAATQDEALAAAADYILGAAETIAKKHQILKILKITEDGRPAKRILKAAEEIGADMIVTGARGISDLKSLVLGSVSHRLVSTASFPCLIVP
jgi:nucleotide-binding universal stress UspA family protein